MSFFENLFPRAAYKHAAWREMRKIQKRSYDAGTHDRLNRNWHTFNESAEFTDRNYRDIVRARSRDLERNSDLMNAQVNPWTRNVVGKGFELEAKTPDEDFNEAIEKLWKRWCKKDNCDVTGTQSFWEMARMAVRRKRVDGGILFIKCQTPDGIIPFKLQALEVDELDTTQFRPHNENCRVVGGVEYNAYNRAVGYHIKQYDIQGYILETRYIPRENVIFIFSKTRPSQIREMPDMASTIGRVKELNGFIEAASMKERIAACLSIFVKKQAPPGSFGRAPEPKKRTNYKQIKLDPGMITELNDGDEIDVVNPGNSATNGSEFIKSMLRLISAGQGLSYEASSRDLSQANYSSARQATIEDEETFIPEQEKLKDEFLDEAYSSFVMSAVLSNAVKAPRGFWENPEEYTAHNWNRKPKKWIDPYKESNANRIALESGQKTINEIWQENGKDYKSVIDEMVKIQEYAEGAGLKTSLGYLGGGFSDEQQTE